MFVGRHSRSKIHSLPIPVPPINFLHPSVLIMAALSSITIRIISSDNKLGSSSSLISFTAFLLGFFSVLCSLIAPKFLQLSIQWSIFVRVMPLTPPPSSCWSRQTSSSSATRRQTVSPLPGSSDTSRRVKGGYTPGMFQCVKSIEDFAVVLCVPVKTILLITIKNKTPCRLSWCPFGAILGNDDHCLAHQQSWYPLKNEKGSNLQGPEFLRSNGKFRGCDCNQPACISSGYFPSQDSFCIPIAWHSIAISTSNLLPTKKKDKLKNDKMQSSSSTHGISLLSIDSQKLLASISWISTRKIKKYYDQEQNVYSFPLLIMDHTLLSTTSISLTTSAHKIDGP